jgi:hypothetical protein
MYKLWSNSKEFSFINFYIKVDKMFYKLRDEKNPSISDSTLIIFLLQNLISKYFLLQFILIEISHG